MKKFIVLVIVILVALLISCAPSAVSGSYNGKVIKVDLSHDTTDGTLFIEANGDNVNLKFNSSFHPTITINNASVSGDIGPGGTVYNIQSTLGDVQGYMSPPNFIDIKYQNSIDTSHFQFIGNK